MRVWQGRRGRSIGEPHAGGRAEALLGAGRAEDGRGVHEQPEEVRRRQREPALMGRRRQQPAPEWLPGVLADAVEDGLPGGGGPAPAPNGEGPQG